MVSRVLGAAKPARGVTRFRVVRIGRKRTTVVLRRLAGIALMLVEETKTVLGECLGWDDPSVGLSRLLLLSRRAGLGEHLVTHQLNDAVELAAILQ